MELILKLRKKIKDKKPKFLCQESHKRKRIKKRWRYPRGIDSKLRLQNKGNGKRPSPGYSSPKAVRGLHKSGLEPVLVKNILSLENLDKKTQGVIIGKTGKRNKVAILKKCVELDLIVLNENNPKKKIEIIEKTRKNKSKLKLEKQAARKKKEEKLKKDKKKKKDKKEDKVEVKKEDKVEKPKNEEKTEVKSSSKKKDKKEEKGAK